MLRTLSGTGGLWRSVVQACCPSEERTHVELVGLEAVTSLLLVATLVYLDVAPELDWRYVN